MAESNQSPRPEQTKQPEPKQPEPEYLPMVGEIVDFRIRFGGSCEWDIG